MPECSGRSPGTSLTPFDFALNPGNLGTKKFVLSRLAPYAPLVVVLHGCTQTPEGYDRGTASIKLAARFGLGVVFTQQLRVNNPNGCFNGSEPGDIRRRRLCLAGSIPKSRR